MLNRQRQFSDTVRRVCAAARLIRSLLAAALLLSGFSVPACASLTVFVGEPFDTFGTLLPVGHATLYLDRVCADGPLRVRMCRTGEPAGVAISRYDHIGPYDWLATPIMEFLYASPTAEGVLPYATPQGVAELRARYRHAVLNDLFPDGTENRPENSEWWESVGMAYTRRLWGYRIATTRAQDERFVAALNAEPNRHRYAAYGANCANFVADWVNFFYPGLVKRNRWADLGFLLPKQVARSLYLSSRTHAEMQLTVFEVPQVPGSIRRSHTVRGGAETFLKTKRYVFPLALVQPEIAVTLFALYLDHGSWKIARPAEIVGPEAFLPSESPLLANR